MTVLVQIKDILLSWSTCKHIISSEIIKYSDSLLMVKKKKNPSYDF